MFSQRVRTAGYGRAAHDTPTSETDSARQVPMSDVRAGGSAVGTRPIIAATPGREGCPRTPVRGYVLARDSDRGWGRGVPLQEAHYPRCTKSEGLRVGLAGGTKMPCSASGCPTPFVSIKTDTLRLGTP
jgi:hypothetical protein